MKHLIAVLTNPEYMGVAGMFLGVNTATYLNMKNEIQYHNFLNAYSMLFGGVIGGSIGVLVPVAVPVYAVSIPSYFLMKYLIKNKMI